MNSCRLCSFLPETGIPNKEVKIAIRFNVSLLDKALLLKMNNHCLICLNNISANKRMLIMLIFRLYNNRKIFFFFAIILILIFLCSSDMFIHYILSCLIIPIYFITICKNINLNEKTYKKCNFT